MTDIRTAFPAVSSRLVTTPRLSAQVFERPADDAGAPDATVVFVHGNVSSSLFFLPLMSSLPVGVRALAVDLRGFGGTETLPVDATRGLRDFSDDDTLPCTNSTVRASAAAASAGRSSTWAV